MAFLYFILFLSITSRHFSILQDIYQFTRHFILLSFKLHCPVVELFCNLFDTTKNYFVPVWIELKVIESHIAFSSFFFFFFFLCMNSAGDKKNIVYALFTNYSYTVYTLFTGLTILFTHLKIILLQCFQFSVSATISSIQTDCGSIFATVSHNKSYLFFLLTL